MKFERLSLSNVEQYIQYLRKAFSEESNLMTAEQIDEYAIKRRLEEPFYRNTTSLLATENGKVVGRIEYHFYGCLQDGYRMAYVDWIFVLREYRHRGIGQALFRAFERDCRENQIDQYYLIEADNKNAERFYSGFAEVERKNAPILRKTLKR